MVPSAWTFEAIVCWEAVPGDGAAAGAWLCGTTTYNALGQGSTPGEAMESLLICMVARAALDLKHRMRSEHELFLIRSSADMPVESMRERYNEIRVGVLDEIADKSKRYIMSGAITRGMILSVKLPERQTSS